MTPGFSMQELREEEQRNGSKALVRAPQAPLSPEVVEKVIVGSDLESLTPQQRVAYYRSYCESLGLNWLTKPFDLIKLNGKLQIYANKGGAAQLCQIRKVSLSIVGEVVIDGVYVVKAAAQLPDGRTDTSTGTVAIDGLRGEARANAMMKAETKAKRRVTLSICGLGVPDESEVETIPNAQRVKFDAETGEVHEAEPPKPAPPAAAADTFAACLALVEGAQSWPDLQAAWKHINAKGYRKSGVLTLEQGAQLADAKDRRKAELQKPQPPKPDASLDTPGAASWGMQATCFYCSEPVGEDAVTFEGPEGAMVAKHPNCTAFGRGREPGED
jgi:hypothetical protein